MSGCHEPLRRSPHPQRHRPRPANCSLAILVAHGGCDAQVRGHVAGNLNVGNDRARLVDAQPVAAVHRLPTNAQRPGAVDDVAPVTETSRSGSLSVLAVGATGSIGRHVVTEAMAAGHRVRALVRSPERAGSLPSGVEIALGDVTRPETLADAVAGIDAVVLTLGSDGLGRTGARTVDYEGVRNVLAAIGSNPVRIALMTAIGVTDREGHYNLTTEAHDWKRRSERLVRASGQEYTIVRPSWFDYNAPDQLRLAFLGRPPHSGSPADGVRPGVRWRVLVASLTSPAAEARRSNSWPSKARPGRPEPLLECWP